MKGISFYYGYDSNFKNRAKLIKEAGFDSVLVYYDENISEIVYHINQQGLEIDALHLPYKNEVNKIWQEQECSKEYLEKLLKGIDFAHKNGIDCVVLHITSSNYPPEKNINGINFINKLLQKCEQYNIYLCLENLRRLDYLNYIYDNCCNRYLAFCFDTGHAHAFTKNSSTFPHQILSKSLKCVHLHDNDGNDDLHLMPFDGNIKWDRIVEYINKYSIDRRISLELHEKAVLLHGNLSEDKFLKICYDKITLFYKMLNEANIDEN